MLGTKAAGNLCDAVEVSQPAQIMAQFVDEPEEALAATATSRFQQLVLENLP